MITIETNNAGTPTRAPQMTTTIESKNAGGATHHCENRNDLYHGGVAGHGNAKHHGFFFLSDEAVNNLPQFQYRGKDLSLLYHYVLSPLADFCVNKLTPRWVAPNAITLTGLTFMISGKMTVSYVTARRY